METEELNLNKESVVVAGSNSKCGDGFIDRSKVRILLCDNDAKSSEEVFTLLLKCSYQVTSVRSARQVIDALNAEGQDIDIILAEVDLPMKKGLKLLKYIARDNELRRIPVIMMSAQDEVSIVVKCLKLGAADYLVKPLRTNELLNLWTHMWRRRRMLGLVEKNILSYDFDLVVSDPSDANTNSTTLFSDDTDDKSKRSTNPETGMPIQQEHESTVAVASAALVVEEPPNARASKYRPEVPGISDRRTGHFSAGPKKSELKIGESSAFFTYVKAAAMKSNSPPVYVDRGAATHLRMEDTHQACTQQGANDLQIHENGETCESHSQDDLPSSNSIPDSFSIERSSTPPASMETSQQKHFMEEALTQGVVNPIMMPSSAQLYQKNLQDLQAHAGTAVIPQYNHLSQCPPHTTGMTSFPYYPMGICLPPGQMSSVHSWPSFGSPSSSEVKISKVDRREAALMKFRQKRKERCFDKKIRYVNRKRLAERRPRVRGQFVRKLNGVNVDLNGQPVSTDYDEDDDEDEEDHAAPDSSPEDA
ncbi:two-component response regulator-like APRR1 isoform X2 [Neltuma alba]|uniref:two-component response regulator-like APRR1 isoform X2 n=1 Tax=Neltuma alba TaxID=207710 RepID=UPI0010A54B24|nr:two-component response regulator-like APRR1 isoform X2 [Prosopis alba]